jgi:hypothetical protein
MLKKLHALLARKGVLSEHIINRSKTLPAASTYRKRFGSLVNAYRAIGFTPLPSGTPKIIKSTCLAGARARSLQRKK